MSAALRRQTAAARSLLVGLRNRSTRSSFFVRSFAASASDDKAKQKLISVDRTGLLGGGSTSPVHIKLDQKTELARELAVLMAARGPITIGEYMKQALTHPKYGYYMKGDVFGEKGDFTTAPEISQMFGELIGIWCVATWKAMGAPPAVNLIEIGPGRGTLMSDLLRTAKTFPDFERALKVFMVETSEALQKIQKEKVSAVSSLPVEWRAEFSQVPRGPSLIVAQELFDAFPIHQFQKTESGWAERLVDVKSDGNFKIVLSPGPTTATHAFLDFRSQRELSPAILSRSASLSSLLEPDEEVGDVAEVSPQSLALAEEISGLLNEHGGGALIVDYGYTSPQGSTLRAIRDHQIVDPLQEPGNCDLTADVDFPALARVCRRQLDVEVHGCIPQGEFLKNMGIEYRLSKLLENASDEQAEELISSFERLCDEEAMGGVYKVMAVTHRKVGIPVGFVSLDSEA